MTSLHDRSVRIATVSVLITAVVCYIMHEVSKLDIMEIKLPVPVTNPNIMEITLPAPVTNPNITEIKHRKPSLKCASYEEPNLAVQRPNILEKGRVRLVDYKTFTDDKSIECVTHYAASPTTKICIYKLAKDKFISKALRARSGWEPAITTSFKKALRACPDCQVLDFGSNLGVYALIAAAENRRVFAVEPMRENLLRLVKSVRVNGWEKRITIIKNTLSDNYEEMEFYRPLTNNPGGAMAKRAGSPPLDPKRYTGPYDSVSSVQIDNLLEVIDIKKAIMKIDIEGYEPAAFRGASRFFAQMDIPVIYLEWGKKGPDPDALKMAMDLAKQGYVAHDRNMAMLKQPCNAAAVKSWPYDTIWKKL